MFACFKKEKPMNLHSKTIYLASKDRPHANKKHKDKVNKETFRLNNINIRKSSTWCTSAFISFISRLLLSSPSVSRVEYKFLSFHFSSGYTTKVEHTSDVQKTPRTTSECCMYVLCMSCV